MSKDVHDLSITRTCSECDRISVAGTCLSGVEMRPHPREPRKCHRFVPLMDAYDMRTGRELWPDKAISEEYDGGVCGFLASQLVFGPMPANEVITRAISVGISKRSIQRAAEHIQVRRTKRGFNGGWIWALSGYEGAK